jgi:nucleoside-diphosphate-sugar epimerase
MLEGKSVVVTGAAGFIGSNLVDELLIQGARVVGIDNLYNGNLENLGGAMNNENFQFFKCDIRDFNFMLEITKDIDVIFHEAAFTSVPQSILMPFSCNDVNVNGTLNILNVALKNGVRKVIFASSSSVYGDLATLPKTEDMMKSPISPYAVSKLTCEGYMRVYSRIYGLDTVTLRYFNVFGPRQKDSPYSGVIAIWLGKIINNEDLIIFGDGQNSRDFTYIKDVIQANLLAASHSFPGAVFNIGAGSPIKLEELAKLMLKLANKPNLKIMHAEARPGDIVHSYADISNAKKLLKFRPKFDQEQGLRDYLNWYGNKYNLKIL